MSLETEQPDLTFFLNSARHKMLIAVALISLAYLVPRVFAQQAIQFPPTTKNTVSDEHHGVKVSEDYRWLEDVNDPAVRQWIDEQNRFSSSLLENIPARATITNRLKDIIGNQRSVTYGSFYQRKMFFALKRQPPKNQPFLVMLNSPEQLESEQTILDPNAMNPKGTTAIDWYVPSHDGRLVAVSLSENGSEIGDVHVYETATGRKLPDVIPRVQYPTGLGSLEWNKESTGFYCTRYPGNERPPADAGFYQQVYFHKLGTNVSEDTYAIGKEFPRVALINLSTSEDGSYLLASVANGTGGEYAHYLLGPARKWRQLTQFSDQVKSVSFGLDGKLYLLSVNGAPRGKILSLSLDDPNLAAAKTVVPESDVTIRSFVPAQTRLYVEALIGGPSEVRVFELRGRRHTTIPTPPVSTVEIGVRLQGDEVLIGSRSYLEPLAWSRYKPATGQLTTSLTSSLSTGWADAQVVRDFATSKDGTKVPLNIIMRKGTKLDGQNPTILFGYGGYGVSLAPNFSPRNRVWLDAGGVYVVANLRGGGEYGDAWHNAGKLTRKQNVFDDFAACARYLIDKKYTSPAKLAIEGGSNGGLLMGASLTQHPELFRAVVANAGIYDMLRWELSDNGAFNVSEFGTVKDREQFRALYAYSPYHNVKDNTSYPAVLFLTGDNDGQVDPMHSRKMTARLQAATTSGLPIVLRTSSTTGHAKGTSLSARIAQAADVLAFLFDQLKIDVKTLSP
ncbi:MAG TPA: prolyl oligopeptidase family serine peptidase [Pyrinomonadaceae bacterium]|nr:prolyl oligopeptidase family serine peptidase [Pyrinomonadaceae bacterium]